MKKLISTFTAITMITALMPAVSHAEEIENLDLKAMASSQSIDNEEQADMYYIYYSDIDTSAIRKVAEEKRREYYYSLYEQGYSNNEVERLSMEYFINTENELLRTAYSEESKKILDMLNINDEDAVCSMFTPIIICSLTTEQKKIAEESEVITSIEPFSPSQIENATEIPTTDNNKIKGDANCNGNVEISDAVAILQYLANSSKYPLTEQGKINADFDGDGITGADALTIQKMDAAMGGNSVFWKENPVISRVGNSSAPNASKECANADKLEDKTEVHAPVFVSKTPEEFDSLVDFISGEYNTQSVLNEGYYKFADAVDIYKDNGEFFKDNFLIVVDIRANSGSIKHALNRVEKNANGEIKVYIDRTSPMAVAADMAEYFMFIECSKSALNDNSTFDAVLSEIKKES